MSNSNFVDNRTPEQKAKAKADAKPMWDNFNTAMTGSGTTQKITMAFKLLEKLNQDSYRYKDKSPANNVFFEETARLAAEVQNLYNVNKAIWN